MKPKTPLVLHGVPIALVGSTSMMKTKIIKNLLMIFKKSSLGRMDKAEEIPKQSGHNVFFDVENERYVKALKKIHPNLLVIPMKALKPENFEKYMSNICSTIFYAMGGVIIAIDGLAGSGKGTIAKLLAKHFDGFHLNSGLLYRYIAFSMFEQGITLKHPLVVKYMQDHLEAFDFKKVNAKRLAQTDVDELTPIWGADIRVREIVFLLQLKTAYGSGKAVIVAEGRNTTTHVFTGARDKYYVKASIDLRAAWRSNDNGKSVKENKAWLTKRDKKDMTRKHHPLRFRPREGVRLVRNERKLEDTVRDMIREVEAGFGPVYSTAKR